MLLATPSAASAIPQQQVTVSSQVNATVVGSSASATNVLQATVVNPAGAAGAGAGGAQAEGNAPILVASAVVMNTGGP